MQTKPYNSTSRSQHGFFVQNLAILSRQSKDLHFIWELLLILYISSYISLVFYNPHHITLPKEPTYIT